MKPRYVQSTVSAVLLLCLLAGQVAGQESPDDAIYVVQRGDTLIRIANLHNSTVEAFTELNDLSDPSLIFVGQQLRIPGSGNTPVVQALPAYVTPVLNVVKRGGLVHRVAGGDSLSEIAAEYGLTTEALAERNGIAIHSLLHVGNEIHIPGLQPQFIDAPWPAPVTGLQTGPAEFREGEGARILLRTSAPARVTGTFLERELHFIPDETGQVHVALIGIPLNVEAGYHALGIDVQEGASLISFEWPLQIHGGVFGREALFLSEEDLETLDRDTENAEHALLQHLVSGFRPGRWFDGMMLRPAVGRITSRFGALRSYNRGSYDRVHQGVDFAAATGSEVRAAAAGVVVLAADLNVRGLSIMLDHGLGVYSGYWHLSAMDVAVGEFVEADSVIGKVGNSGRSTGSHLHWQLWVNGVTVDPLQWLRTDFLEPLDVPVLAG